MSYCELVSVDETTCEFHNTTFPRARKEHVCINCRLPIPVGTRYAKETGKWDGEFSESKHHLECRAITNLLGMLCDGPYKLCMDIHRAVSELIYEGDRAYEPDLWPNGTHVLYFTKMSDEQKKQLAELKEKRKGWIRKIIKHYSRLLEKYDKEKSDGR